MTTTENPTGALTRRQLRELRLTGQTPQVTGEGQVATPAAPPTPPRREAPPTIAPMSSAARAQTFAPTYQPRTPAVAPVAPPAGDEGNAEDRPRSRREARELDRVRTGAVNIIPTVPRPDPLPGAGLQPRVETPAVAPAASWTAAAEAVQVDEGEVQSGSGLAAADADERIREAAAQRPTVRPGFGAAVLDTPAQTAASSFDDLITHDSSGTTSAGNALILGSDMLPPLTAPVTSTGQTLVTGTFNLPDGLGSRGHAPGVADGREVDAVLIDGELPASSSPTPIAATAAVNQAKAPGEIMQPPAPEKSNRVMLWLAISAGALAAALTAVVVWAWMTQALG